VWYIYAVAKILTTEWIFATEAQDTKTQRTSDDEQNERHWAEAAWPLLLNATTKSILFSST
jgi:hypothetical protein